MGKWVPPPPRMIKINIDAAVHPHFLSFGVGIVARYEHGVVIFAKAASIPSKFPPYLAEMYDEREAVRLAHIFGEHRWIIETDAINVANAIYKDSPFSLEAPMITEIRYAIEQEKLEKVQHCYREANYVAHTLEKEGLSKEKELPQLAVFGELRALFPGVNLHIDFVGPEIPHHRNGEKVGLYSYAECDLIDCQCKCPVEKDNKGITTHNLQAITLQLHAGCYHDRFGELVKDSVPNAGIAAYMSWFPTLNLIKEIKVPAVFSDYCEETSHLAARCITSGTGSAPKIPIIQLNPFRHPLQVEERALFLPCYSNCFLFGI